MRVVAAAWGRADRVLAAAAPGTSRQLLLRAFAEGRVRHGGRRLRKGDPVAPGDVLEVAGPLDRAALAPAPEPDLPLAVVFEDDHLLALDKPAGRPAQPLEAGERGTLANALVARHPECVAAGDDPREAGLAHRLDAGTSGLVLAARRRAVWLSLRAAFHEGAVRKEYLALVEGALERPFTVELPLEHDRAAGGVRVAPAGLPAVTEVRPERRLGAYTLVRCVARSGRMHQVRAHLGASGFPCAGDARYGARRSDLRTEGPFLHAARLELAHPVTGARLALEVGLPEARRKIVEELAAGEEGPG